MPWASGLPIAVGAIVGACNPNGAPCMAPSCGAGYECLANTCAPMGADPVPKGAIRVVVEPASVAALGGPGSEAETAVLGQDAAAAIYLRFDAGWKRRGAVLRAFLLILPAPDATRNADDVPIEVWKVQSAWSPPRIAVGIRPNLGPPHARGIVRSSPPMVARVDVTALAAALASTDTDDGVAVLAGATGDRGVGLRTGSSGGAPKLEVYLRPSP